MFAERIGGRQYGKSTAIYKFEKIKRAKRAALAANPGAEIIDMGVGEPDEMAFPEVAPTNASRGTSSPGRSSNRPSASNAFGVSATGWPCLSRRPDEPSYRKAPNSIKI